MDYKINPAAWGTIFPVPSAVVDHYLRLASAAQLKVLLWLLRHASQNFDIAILSQSTGINEQDIHDAIQFWTDCGILINSNQQGMQFSQATSQQTVQTVPETTVVSQPAKEDAVREEKPQLAPLPLSKPTVQQVACRISESPELKLLFHEAQLKLGRTIGYDGQSVLLMMHDQYGLPVEVILTIIEYASSQGKTSTAYIAKLGKDWGEREIDCLEKAEEHIEYLNSAQSLWGRLKAMAGMSNPKPTTVQSEFLLKWNKELGFDIEMIYLAYEQMANNCQKLSFPYINKVLGTWHEQGIKTPAQLEQAEKERKQTNKSKKNTKSNQASYDLEEYTNRTIGEPPVYKKRGKNNGV